MACCSVLSRLSHRDIKIACAVISCAMSDSPLNVPVLLAAFIAVECFCYNTDSTDRSATAGRRRERGVYSTIVQ
jgi:hypothetical protein